MMKKLVIIGGGISGLSLAYFLRNSGFNITLLEKEGAVGGKIKTVKKNGYTLECGPNTVLFQEPALKTLITELGLKDEVLFSNTEKSKNRFIITKNGLGKVPMSPGALISSELLSASSKFKLLTEPFRKVHSINERTSIYDFFKERFGESVCENLLDPFVTGIYAGNIQELSLKYSFPKLFDAVLEKRSVFKGMISLRKSSPQNLGLFNFENGLDQLVSKIYSELQDIIELKSQVDSISFKDKLYSIQYIQGSKAVELEADYIVDTRPISNTESDLGLTGFFPTVNYVPIKTIHLGFNEESVTQLLPGFGLLTTRNSNRKFLGAIFNSDIFKDKAPAGKRLFTLLAGGARNPEIVSENQSTDLIVEDFVNIMKIRAQPEFIHEFSWNQAIPQYGLNHFEFEKSIDSFQNKFSNYFLLGNYSGGVSIGDCVKKSKLLSDVLISRG